MGVMPGTPQTSVLLTLPARTALDRLTKRWQISRDGTVRTLLRAFVADQKTLDEDHRRTHISTAVSWPLCLRGLEPPPTTRLTFRAGGALTAAAVDLAYRLPGRAPRQSHRDYSSRPLTDALLTALAGEEDFVDEGLEGLPAAVTWSQADGLWRLVVGATLTETERRIYARDDPLLAKMLQEGAAVWHSPWRSQVALHMARNLFTGTNAAANLAWVGAQQDEFNEWLENVSHSSLRVGDHDFTEGAAPEHTNSEGRAATTVWRVKRQIALDGLARWLTEGAPGDSPVDPPGWVVRQPAGWTLIQLPARQPLPPHVEAAIARGAVLRINQGRNSALWPLNATKTPVKGVEELIAGARQLGLSDLQIVECLSLTRPADKDGPPAAVVFTLDMEDSPDDDDDDDTHELGPGPYLLAAAALEGGLISLLEHDDLVARCEEHAAQQIHDTVKRAELRRGLTDSDLARLIATTHDPKAFAGVAHDLGYRFRLYLPTWLWEVTGPIEILESGATSEQLVIRGREWCRHVHLELEENMQTAWTKAMWDVMPSHRDES